MKTIITKAGDYTLAIEVTAPKRPQGHFSLEITSNYSSARFPDEWRRVFQTTLDRDGAQSIADALNEALCNKERQLVD